MNTKKKTENRTVLDDLLSREGRLTAPTVLKNIELKPDEVVGLERAADAAAQEFRETLDWAVPTYNRDTPESHQTLEEVLPMLEEHFGPAATALGIQRYFAAAQQKQEEANKREAFFHNATEKAEGTALSLLQKAKDWGSVII
ncbi:hypothetical protein HZB02_06565 [Candidatus Woesearchaeota archaeon]|nr:hypothetical protein [Candidatus Woesearchaeota archaeon]